MIGSDDHKRSKQSCVVVNCVRFLYIVGSIGLSQFAYHLTNEISTSLYNVKNLSQ